MTDSLKRVVTFTDVLAGATVSLPHNLQVSGNSVRPDEVKASQTGFMVIGTTTTLLTVKNTGSATASCQFLCEAWHPIERHFGQSQGDGTFGQHLEPYPWVSASGGGGGGDASPEYLTVTNASGVTVLIGSPVTALGVRGDAASLSTSNVVAMALAQTAATLPINAQCGGAMVLTTAQWNAVTGGSGGLTAGARYFLGASPGTISTSPPSVAGQCVVALGMARDATTLILEISQPIVL